VTYTRIIVTLILCAVALPALAVEPATTKTTYTITTAGGTAGVAPVIQHMPPMAPELVAAEVARVNAETDRIQAEAKHIRAQTDDPTTNGSVLGRPSMSTPTNPEELTACSFGMDQEAFSGRQGRKLAPYVPDCIVAQAELVDAIYRGKNASKAIDKDVAFHSDGDSTAVKEAAVIDALSDNDGAVGLGGFGNGVAGIPFNHSIVGAYQGAATGVQALQASSSIMVPRLGAAPTPVPGVAVNLYPPRPTAQPELTDEQKRAITQRRIDEALGRDLN